MLSVVSLNADSFSDPEKNM